MKPNTPRSGRILVIDDERFIAELMRDVLTRHGHSVEMQNSGPLALEATKKSRFDLVISDFAMPGLNGLDFIREMRASAPATRVLIVSAFLDSDAIESLEAESNFAGFLRKPFDIFELTKLADRLLSGVTASSSNAAGTTSGARNKAGNGAASAKDPIGPRTHPFPPTANEGFAR